MYGHLKIFMCIGTNHCAKVFKFFNSSRGSCVDLCLLECDAFLSGRQLMKYRRKLLASSSQCKNEDGLACFSKTVILSLRLHRVTFHKTLIAVTFYTEDRITTIPRNLVNLQHNAQCHIRKTLLIFSNPRKPKVDAQVIKPSTIMSW